LLAGAFVLLLVANAQAVQLVKVGGFSAPTYVTAPPGDSSRLFVTQQPGKIELVVNGQKQAAPFLDLTSKVKPPGSTEQGLLSMAFAPDYATSGRFYVYYTSRNCPSSPGCDEHVSEFHRSAANPNVADPASERLLLTIPHPGDSNHNGGQLQFGPDGRLYIGTGDGGGNNDSHQNAQKRTSLLGKILRMDPNSAATLEVWAYGLRNPWRFSFDRGTGNLLIADVGEGAWEEVDLAPRGQAAGANYGWPCYEGGQVNGKAPSGECNPKPSPVVAPVWQYPHSCSSAHPFCGSGIIGGYVVRDPALGPLVGRYVYGDLAKAGLRSVVLGQPSASGDAPLGVNVSGLSTFGEDAGGCIYAASLSSGAVYRIAPDANPSPGPCPVAGQAAPAPQLKLSVRKTQHILRSRRLRISVTVLQPSRVVAVARITVSRLHNHVIAFHGATRNGVAAGKRAILHLRLSRHNLRALRRLLHRRHTMVAKITVSVTGPGGGSATAVKAVRLVR
jgi:hypothetical protein